MKNLLLAILLSVSASSIAQKLQVEFGRLTQAEIDMKVCKLNPDAGAVVLFDIGETKFVDSEGGYDIRFTKHKRIKIFNKSGFESAEVSIPFYVDGSGKTEYVKSIKAVTYNLEEGKLVRQELDPSTIYVEKVSQKWRVKKFVFPNIQEGSIIEYQYVLETPFHFNLPDWTFQDVIPTLYSEYEVRMIPFYEYVYTVQGSPSFNYHNSIVANETRSWGNVVKSYGQNIGTGIEFNDYVHTFVLKDVPAFEDESYISSISDYIIKIDFQLSKFYSPKGTSKEIMSTWSKLNESLLKNEYFGKYIGVSSRIAKKILKENLDLSGLSEQEKSVKIIDYVKSNFTWNGYSSKYTDQSAKDFFNKKSGNSADMNLFLLSLLNEAGVESLPVILSTRNHGKIKTDYPFDHYTNYVVVMVNTPSSFLTDGTESLLAFNRLPPRCINEKGLIVSDDEQEGWVLLTHNIPSIERLLILLEINPQTLNAEYTVNIQTTEYDAYGYRDTYHNDSVTLRELFSNKMGEIDALSTSNYAKPEKPYSIFIKGVTDTDRLGDNLVINPFLNLAITKNKLTQKVRSYPVDLIYPGDTQFEITVQIPDGYRLSSVPEGYNMDNGLAEIKLNYEVDENAVRIAGNYKFKKSIYTSQEYSRIKYYFNTIIKKFNEQIVLEKIS